MSVSEAEEILEIDEEDKIDCPYGDDCENCPLGYSAIECEEFYIDWLMSKIAEKFN